MIPDLEVGPEAHGEALFYKWLKSGLPDGYRVFHGVHLLDYSGGSMRRGETDFLVLHREKGLLVIEVKGGRIRRVPSRNQWVSTSHDGREYTIKDPFLQAERNVNTLARRIRAAGVFGPGPLPVTLGYAVAFPDGIAPREDLPLHVEPGIVIDHGDRDAIAPRVDRIFDTWRGKRPGSRGFTEEEYQALLRKVLLARYEVTVPLNVRFELEEDRFVALTDVQCRLLKAVAGRKRALFKGYAGTGKTQLLMGNARRFAQDGARVLVLCYNQPLAAYLTIWADAAGLRSGGGPGAITVRNFHGLCEEYARRAGLDFDVPERAGEQREFYEDIAPMLLEDALKTIGDRFDCVLVDEGQDFRPEWLEVAAALLEERGRDVFHIFYDEQQNVYGKELRFPFEAETYALGYNCRSTARICDLAGKLGRVDIECMPGWVEGEKVRFFGYRDSAEQVRLIEGIVRDLMKRGVATRQIMIVSSHRRARSCMAGVSRLNGYPLIDFTPPGEEDTIAFSTLHRAKGLESDVVVFCDVDGGEPYCSRANQYVAVSRARHLLYVVHRKDWRPPKPDLKTSR